jgi:hypothetical protein
LFVTAVADVASGFRTWDCFDFSQLMGIHMLYVCPPWFLFFSWGTYRHSCVGTATGRGFDSSTPQHLDQLWGALSLLLVSVGYRGLSPQG